MPKSPTFTLPPLKPDSSGIARGYLSQAQSTLLHADHPLSRLTSSPPRSGQHPCFTGDIPYAIRGVVNWIL